LLCWNLLFGKASLTTKVDMKLELTSWLSTFLGGGEHDAAEWRAAPSPSKPPHSTSFIILLSNHLVGDVR
ncbi:hypothetical protein FA13DRAFT_1732130, partial [Coprinellus micaceus]